MALRTLRRDADLFGGGCVTCAIVARVSIAEVLYAAAWQNMADFDAGRRFLAPPATFTVTQLCASWPVLGRERFGAMLDAKGHKKELAAPAAPLGAIWLSLWSWRSSFHTGKDGYFKRCYPAGGGPTAGAAAVAAAAAADAQAASLQGAIVAGPAERWLQGYGFE